jgi:hypothetical protein
VLAVWGSGRRCSSLAGLVHLIRFPETVARTLDASSRKPITDDATCCEVAQAESDRGRCVRGPPDWFPGSAVGISVAHSFSSILFAETDNPVGDAANLNASSLQWGWGISCVPVREKRGCVLLNRH